MKNCIFIANILLIMLIAPFNLYSADDPRLIEFIADGFGYPVSDINEKNYGWEYSQIWTSGTPNTLHPGIDFNTTNDCGRQVSSVANGIILYCDNAGSSWGGVVLIQHRFHYEGGYKNDINDDYVEYCSQYAHIAPLDSIKVGDYVYKGQKIGYIAWNDNACNSFEGVTNPHNFNVSWSPHLHFEVREDETLSADHWVTLSTTGTYLERKNRVDDEGYFLPYATPFASNNYLEESTENAFACFALNEEADTENITRMNQLGLLNYTEDNENDSSRKNKNHVLTKRQVVEVVSQATYYKINSYQLDTENSIRYATENNLINTESPQQTDFDQQVKRDIVFIIAARALMVIMNGSVSNLEDCTQSKFDDVSIHDVSCKYLNYLYDNDVYTGRSVDNKLMSYTSMYATRSFVAEICDGLLDIEAKDNYTIISDCGIDLDEVIMFAKLSKAVYENNIDDVETWKKIDDYAADIVYELLTGAGSTSEQETFTVIDPIGFHASLYSNNSNILIIAYEGTTASSLMDWDANLSHALTNTVPKQYSEGLIFAEKILSEYPNHEIILTGHSLGGGIATFVGLSLGLKAYTFNPAGLWSSTISKIPEIDRSLITNFVVVGYSDILGNLFQLEDIVSNTGILFGRNCEIDIPMLITNPLTIHSINTIVTYLENISTGKEKFTYYEPAQEKIEQNIYGAGSTLNIELYEDFRSGDFSLFDSSELKKQKRNNPFGLKFPYTLATRSETLLLSMLITGYKIEKDLQSNYIDVSTMHPLYDVIETATKLGIVVGYVDENNNPTNEFKPDNSISRIETLKILFKTFQLDLLENTEKGPRGRIWSDSFYSDIDKAHWSYKYIRAAYLYEIMDGYGNGKFGPNDEITRSQVVKIVHQAMQLSNDNFITSGHYVEPETEIYSENENSVPTGSVVTTKLNSDTYTLKANYTDNEGHKLSYYWIADGGKFENLSTNETEVNWISPIESNRTQFTINLWVHDGHGQLSIAVNLINTTTTELNNVIMILKYLTNQKASSTISELDLTQDNIVDLKDAIKGLQVEAGLFESSEINNDLQNGLIAYYEFENGFYNKVNKKQENSLWENSENLIIQDGQLKLLSSSESLKGYVKRNFDTRHLNKIQVEKRSFIVPKGQHFYCGVTFKNQSFNNIEQYLSLIYNFYHYTGTNEVGQYTYREHFYIINTLYGTSGVEQNIVSDTINTRFNKWIKEKITLDYENQVFTYSIENDDGSDSEFVAINNIVFDKNDQMEISINAWDWQIGSEHIIDYLKIYSIKNQHTNNDYDDFQKGLIAHYEFENNLFDSSGNDYHIINTSVDYKNFVIGQGIQIKDKLSLSADASNDILSSSIYTQNFTISCWVMFYSIDNTYNQIINNFDSLKPSSEEMDYRYSFELLRVRSGLEHSKNKLLFQVKSGKLKDIYIVDSIEEMKSNIHYFCTTTYNGKQIRLFINGELQDETEFTGNINIISNPIYIGGAANISENINGIIDDLRIYNRALTEFEIKKLYNKKVQETIDITTGIIAHYEFEDNAHDSSAKGNHGQEHGCIEYTNGLIGKSANFDGIDDFIEIIPKENSFTSIKDFTISAWTYLSDWKYQPKYKSDRQYIFDGHTNSPQSPFRYENGFAVIYDYIYNTRYEEIHNFINYTEPGLSTTDSVEENTAVQNIKGYWHHIIFMRKSDIIYTYWDGMQIYNYVTKDNPLDMNHSLFIGTATGNNTSCQVIKNGFNPSFKGKIDDFRIYNRALNMTEINELYNKRE